MRAYVYVWARLRTFHYVHSKLQVTNYYYIGGYYGACNELAMMAELQANGPITTDFMVYTDLYTYSGGVYVHDANLTEVC